jgi:hypothetical protein
MATPGAAAPFESWLSKGFADSSPGAVMIHADGKFWMPGSSGLSHSEDGIQWTYRPNSPVLSNPYRIAHGSGGFLMPIATGTTVVSPDGEHWTYHRSSPGGWGWGGSGPVGLPVQPVAFGHGWFYSSSPQDAPQLVLYRSRDGAAWSPVRPLGDGPGGVWSISFLNDKLLVSATITTNGAFQTVLLASDDGETWQSHDAPGWWSIATDGNAYLGQGTNLTAFTLAPSMQIIGQTPAPSDRTSIAYGNGRFVAAGDGILASTNGLDWVSPVLPAVGRFGALAFGNGRFVAAAGSAFAVSTNGLDWQVEGRPLSAITGLTAQGETIVASGTKTYGPGSAIVVSTNRGQWKVLDVLPATNVVTALANSGSQFVAAAGTKTFYSTDLAEWTAVDSSFDGVIRDIAFFEGRFWGAGTSAEGDGVLVHALPGEPWTVSQTLFKRPLAAIAASAERIVAAGGTNVSRGYVLGSSDGTNWDVERELGFQPYSATHLAGRFFVSGHFAGRAVSSNGMDWVQTSDGHELLKPIVKAGDWFVAVNQSGAEGTMMLLSRDGVAWERASFGETRWGTSGVIEKAVVAGSRFVLARGGILAETEPLAPVMRGIRGLDSKLRLEFRNWTTGLVSLEASHDLRNWSTVPGLGDSIAEIETGAPWQFFRARAQ